jgi:hypothetical protein
VKCEQANKKGKGRGAATPVITPKVCNTLDNRNTLNEEKGDFMLSTNYKLRSKVDIQ